MISRDTRVKDLQDAFRHVYPYLGIRFSIEEWHSQRLQPRHREITENIGAWLPDGVGNFFIDVSGERLVMDVEDEFLTMGINAQVLRMSGQMAIEIRLTRDWTLAKQNDEAKALNSLFTV